MRRGLMLQFLFMLSYGAFTLVFALTVQDGLRASPLRSGLAILPMAVAFFAGSLFTPRAITRLGARKTVAVGATVDGIGLAGLILIVRGGWPHVGLLTLAPALAVAGVGQALVFGSLFRFVLADVPEHHAGVGGGVLVTIQQSGLALGVATLGTLYLGLETHGIPQAFAAATVAQIAIIAVLAVASRAVPHRDPPGDRNSAPTRPVPTDPNHSGGQKN
jgi:MFS family permease